MISSLCKNDQFCTQDTLLSVLVLKRKSLRYWAFHFFSTHVREQSGLVCVLRPLQTRTHCCGHIVADTNVSLFARVRNICCGHKKCFWSCSETFCVRKKCFPVCAAQETSLSNNVSSFASTFTETKPNCNLHKAAIIFSQDVWLSIIFSSQFLVSTNCLKILTKHIQRK